MQKSQEFVLSHKLPELLCPCASRVRVPRSLGQPRVQPGPERCRQPARCEGMAAHAQQPNHVLTVAALCTWTSVVLSEGTFRFAHTGDAGGPQAECALTEQASLVALGVLLTPVEQLSVVGAMPLWQGFAVPCVFPECSLRALFPLSACF